MRWRGRRKVWVAVALVGAVCAAVAIRATAGLGMDRARAEGKRIGRPKGRPVEEHRRWAEVRELVLAGTLSRAEGARRLKVRYESFVAALNA